MVTVHARGLNSSIKDYQTGNSLVVHWLGLHTSTVEGTGSIPALGTEILHAAWRGQKKKPFFNKGFLKQQM